MPWMTILGLQWKGGRFSHPFDIVNVPHRGGIFKLHGRRPDGTWEVFFVSQTSNLYLGLLAYVSNLTEGEAASGISVCARERVAAGDAAYSYAEVADETERAGCLRSLCEYFNPSCSSPEQIPSVQGIACNPY